MAKKRSLLRPLALLAGGALLVLWFVTPAGLIVGGGFDLVLAVALIAMSLFGWSDGRSLDRRD